MTQKKTVLIQVEIPEARCITAHFMQVVYDDNGQEIGRSARPHTVTFMPDANHKAVLKEVNDDITTREGMKWNPIEPEEWARACGHCKIEHTPAVKAAYKDFKKAAALKAVVGRK